MSTLPEVTIPVVSSYSQIYQRAKAKVASRKIRAALVNPTDVDMLQAFTKAASEGYIEPIVVGNPESLKNLLADNKLELAPKLIVEVNEVAAATSHAAKMAAEGQVDLIVKGRALTSDILSQLFMADSHFLVKDKVVSHVAVMKPQRYPKLLLVTDGGVTIQPDLKTKLSLIQNLIGVAKAIGLENPRLAILAAVEVVYPTMPVTMEAAILSKMAERGQIKGAIIDGPLSFDCSVDMFAAHSKGVKNSQVAGQADAMLAPNIETANGIYKAMTLYGECEMGGVIVGGRVPLAVGSRSDNARGKFNSIVLGVLTA